MYNGKVEEWKENRLLNRRYESRSEDVHHEEREREREIIMTEKKKIWNFSDSRRICGSHDEYEWNESRGKGSLCWLIDLVRDRDKWKKYVNILLYILSWITVALIVSFFFTFLSLSLKYKKTERYETKLQRHRQKWKNDQWS